MCLSGYFKVLLNKVPWVPEGFPRLRRGASSAAGRRHERDRNRKPCMKSLWHIEYRFTDRAGGSVALTWLMRYPHPPSFVYPFCCRWCDLYGALITSVLNVRCLIAFPVIAITSTVRSNNQLVSGQRKLSVIKRVSIKQIPLY